MESKMSLMSSTCARVGTSRISSNGDDSWVIFATKKLELKSAEIFRDELDTKRDGKARHTQGGHRQKGEGKLKPRKRDSNESSHMGKWCLI